MVKLLKACNQAIIAPAVLRLKSTIGGGDRNYSFPYKDVRGGWKIFIDINTDNVVITHQKEEQSFEPDNFNFEWKFQIILDRQLNDITNISLKIENLKFGTLSPQNQLALRGLMKRYL